MELEAAKKVYEERKIDIKTLGARVRHVVQSCFAGRRVVVFSGGKAKDAQKKLATTPPKYDTLAGLDGVWYWSDFIEIQKGKREIGR